MNDSVLVDTDVASYIFKSSPVAKPFRPHLTGMRVGLAFVSVAERSAFLSDIAVLLLSGIKQ